MILWRNAERLVCTPYQPSTKANLPLKGEANCSTRSINEYTHITPSAMKAPTRGVFYVELHSEHWTKRARVHTALRLGSHCLQARFTAGGLVHPCSQFRVWIFAWIRTWNGAKDTQDPYAIRSVAALEMSEPTSLRASHTLLSCKWIWRNLHPIRISVNAA